MRYGITLRQANFRMELHQGHKISKWTSNLSYSELFENG
jgi:hypothetical protein